MILQIDGWKFQVFSVATRKYYAKEYAEHCSCAYCRNFYAAVDGKYPQLRGFLDRFGVHVEAPDEMISFRPTLCSNYYSVCGEILERGEEPIELGGITVEPMAWEEAMTDTDLDPCFFLYVSTMDLPWVLDEPMEKAVSSAKEQDAISRLLQRWIK